MRGGRNKFGPMYKRDRALKQQKKALIRANGIKLETVPQIVSPVQTDYSIATNIHNIHPVSKNLPSNPAPMTPVEYDRGSYGPPPIGMTLPNHPPLSSYHYASFQSRTIKSEYPDHYSNVHDPSTAGGYVYPEAYTSTSPPDIPEVILKLLQLEPDEPQIKARIISCLQQEQNKSRHEKLSMFGLMCKMADQTLFSIVEWARSCIYFKELEVIAFFIINSLFLFNSTVIYFLACCYNALIEDKYICELGPSDIGNCCNTIPGILDK